MNVVPLLICRQFYEMLGYRIKFNCIMRSGKHLPYVAAGHLSLDPCQYNGQVLFAACAKMMHQKAVIVPSECVGCVIVCRKCLLFRIAKGVVLGNMSKPPRGMFIVLLLRRNVT